MRTALVALVTLVSASALAETPAKPYTQAPIYKKLRAQALAFSADDARSKAAVYGVVVEIGYPEAVATLVSLADGTTSLYFSNGGGKVGAEDSPKVAAASKQLVSESAADFDKLTPTVETPLPLLDHTRFYLLTTSGLRTGEALEETLADQKHPLSQLFYWAQAVLTEIRLHETSDAQKAEREPPPKR